MLKTFMEVTGRLGSNGSDLFIATRVAGDEQNRDSAKLERRLTGDERDAAGAAKAYLGLVVEALLAIEMKRVFGSEASVFSVEFAKVNI